MWGVKADARTGCALSPSQPVLKAGVFNLFTFRVIMDVCGLITVSQLFRVCCRLFPPREAPLVLVEAGLVVLTSLNFGLSGKL